MSINLGSAILYLNADPRELNRALVKAKKNSRRNMTGIFDLTRTVGRGFAVMGGAITAAAGLAVRESMSFRGALAEVSTLGVQDLEAIGDAARATARTFGLDVIDAVNASYQAISAGAAEAEVPFVLEESAMAASAGMTDLKTAVELGMGTVNAFGLDVRDITGVFDEAFTAVRMGVTTFEELAGSVGKVASIMAAAGLETDEMFAATAALTKGGISTAESVTALRGAITNIINPTRNAEKMAQQLGLEFNAQALQAQGLEGFLQSVREATGGNTETMAQLFGNVRGLNAVLALTGEQAGEFSSILREMEGSTGATQEAFDRLVEAGPGFAWRVLKAEIKDLLIEIGDNLLPILKRVVDGVTPVVRSIGEWIRENPELSATITIVVTSLGVLMALLAPILIMLPGIVAAFTMAKVAVGFFAAALGLVSAPVLLIIAAVAALGAAVWFWWDEIVDASRWLLEQIKTVFTALGDFFMSVWRGLVDGVQWAWDRVAGFFGAIIDGARQAISWLTRLIGLSGEAGGGVPAPGIPPMAAGGVMPQTGLALVGERGPELAALPRGTRVMPSDEMRAALGGGGDTVVNVNVSAPNAVGLDTRAAERIGRMIAPVVSEALAERVRGRGGS